MQERQDKVIISDTSCLIGLTNIGRLDILYKLYKNVIITPEVANEYSLPLPEWLCVQAVKDPQKTKAFNKIIDLGESSSIALATEIKDAMLIVDDRRARNFALEMGIEITGTLGVLIRAYEIHIIDDIEDVVAELRRIHFRIPLNTENLVKELIR